MSFIDDARKAGQAQYDKEQAEKAAAAKAAADAAATAKANADMVAAQKAESERQAAYAKAVQASQTNATASKAAQAPISAQQTQLNQMLMDRASGKNTSLAELQMQATQQAAQQGAMAQAASARGDVNPAMLQRNLMQNQAAGQQQLVQQSGIARLQDQQAAQSQLMQGLSTQMGQEQNQQQMQNDLAKSYEALGLDSSKAMMMAQLQMQQLQVSRYGIDTQAATTAATTAAQIQAQKDAADKAMWGQILGGVLGGVGSIGAAGITAGATKAAAEAASPYVQTSDERSKTDIKDGEKDVYKFLDALAAHSYKYKDQEKDGEGEHVSVMAQELEKHPMGKMFVEEDEDGTKKVNYGKGFGAILAAQAELHDRMKKLEKKG